MSEQKYTPAQVWAMKLPVDMDGVREELVRLLALPGVAEFIRELMRRASAIALKENPNNKMVEGGDLLKVYDIIRTEFDGLVRAGSSKSIPGANYAYGSIAAGKAMIQIGPHWPDGSYTMEGVKKYYNREDALFALHETMHLAGREVYSDRHYAMALCEMLNEPHKLPPGDDRFAFSNYWGEELKKRCGFG